MNLDNIKTVDICFENCEVFSVPVESVNHLYITGIKESIFIGKYTRTKHKRSEYTYLLIDKEANKKELMHLEKDVQPFERALSYPDIVSIGFTYKDHVEDEVYVNWEGEDDYVNPLQNTSLNKNEDLVIEIGAFSKR